MHQTRQMQKVYRTAAPKAVLEFQRGVNNIFVRTMPLHYMCLRQHHAKKNANPLEKSRNFGATGLRLHRLPITNTVAARCRSQSKIVLSALYHSSPRSQCKLILEGCPCTILFERRSECNLIWQDVALNGIIRLQWQGVTDIVPALYHSSPRSQCTILFERRSECNLIWPDWFPLRSNSCSKAWQVHTILCLNF